MPISRKRFSKKRVKNQSKKNTRKYKRKSGKRPQFFGGFGEDEECPICLKPLTDNENGEVFTTNCQHNFHRGCIEKWCNGKRTCHCPMCKTILNPNPNPNRRQRTPVEPSQNLYRVEFFRTDEENNKVPVRVQDISRREMANIIAFLVNEFDDLDIHNMRFHGVAEDNPYGYIVLGDNHNVRIIEGDIDLEYVTNISSLRFTQVPNTQV
jgi:hypothetical protein